MRIKRSTINFAAYLMVMWAAIFSINGNALSATALQQGVPSLAPMLREVTPAVVSIRVVRTVTAQSRQFFNGEQLPEELQRFFNRGVPENLPQRQAMGAGSGVIVDAGQGFIVTNNHVVEGADEITVSLKDGRNVEANLVGSDPGTDLALLKVEADDLTALSLADSDTAEIGDFVVAIGNPFGIGQTVTAGIVSALGRAGLNNDNYEDFIQTDASINMGNSGGALVDMEGRLLGINTAIISGNGGGSDGIGFAVPANMVASVISHLERDGEVRRGMLGVQISNLNPDMAQSLDLDVMQGALVTNVLPQSAAEAAGIELYDVIVEIDGNRVEDSRDLRNYVGLMRQNEEVALKLIRNGSEMEIDAVIGNAVGGSSVGDINTGEIDEFEGAQLRTLPADSDKSVSAGVEVMELVPQSRAWLAGLRAGDVIIEVNRESVSNVSQFNQRIEEVEGITAFTVVREERRMLIMLP